MTSHPATGLGPPGHPSIGDHGLIGDLRTAALVDRAGAVNWLCWPRFDDPPLFDRILDPDDGGAWQVAPSAGYEASRGYLPDTNVIETTFTCADGQAVGRDLMAVPTDDGMGTQLIRIIEATAGAVPLQSTVRAGRRFTATRAPLRVEDDALVIADGDHQVRISCTAPMTIQDGVGVTRAVVRPGQPFVAVLSAGAPPGHVVDHAQRVATSTTSWWRRWLADSDLPDSYRDAVARSALTLKLLTHQPTSGLVAAPTTSLPEHPGGSRNWDYRYTWLRDSSLSVLALQRLGHHDEAMAFWDWLARVADRHGPDLSVAYTLDGCLIPGEREITALAGHKQSRPVRIGNAADVQRQHDVYGHVIAAAAHCYHNMDMDTAQPAATLRQLADLAAKRWNRPDDSIWEVRSDRDHFVYSRLMCWLALDRAVDLAHHRALDGNVDVWTAQRGAIRHQVESRAWNPPIEAFTGTIDGAELDAAVLVAPLIGFLPPHDPRCRATRRAITARLDDNGLLRRYHYDDGVTEPEGAFLLCTLWLADNHTLDGDPDRGAERVERVLATANDLGLLAEQADPTTGEPLGNFPQGLTHLGVIQSAIRLEARPQTL